MQSKTTFISLCDQAIRAKQIVRLICMLFGFYSMTAWSQLVPAPSSGLPIFPGPPAEVAKPIDPSVNNKMENEKIVRAVRDMMNNPKIPVTPEMQRALSELDKEIRKQLQANPSQDPKEMMGKAYSELRRKGIHPGMIEDIKARLRGLKGLMVEAKGTGRTTGHVATLQATNPNDEPVSIIPQDFYIPSDGKYQPYIGRIPEGTTIPPHQTIPIPVTGYCADVHTPPVPLGDAMPPVTDWTPVGAPYVIPILKEFESPTPEIINPVVLIPSDPVPSFSPTSIPGILHSSAFEKTGLSEAQIILTWPGTDTPVGGTADPAEDPITFAPIMVELADQVEETYEQLREEGVVLTPFSGDPPKERDAVVQQLIWVYLSELSGEPYQKSEFGEKVYTQFESTTGKSVSTLPEEQKENLDSGIDDFWNTFTAVGVEAKVISDTSPGIDPNVLATVRVPKCNCNNISYHLEVTKGVTVVHSEDHTTPKDPIVSIQGFKYGDILDIKITSIKANCVCDDAECLFYPAQSTSKNSPHYTDPDLTRPGKADIEMENDPEDVLNENGNCLHKDNSFNADGTEYSFKLETKDERKTNRAVFQKLRIKAYCKLDDCTKGLCAKYIQLSILTAK